MLSRHQLYSKSRSRKMFDEINVTPIVDVMLVLLIVFMVTSPILISHFDVNLPNANSSEKSLQGHENLQITISKANKIYLLDTVVNKNQLQSKLSTIFQSRATKKIILCADSKISYQELMSVMEIIHFVGFKHISLITNPDKS